ncbi:MAG: c-type cytochrome [Ramlibacter sp.]
MSSSVKHGATLLVAVLLSAAAAQAGPFPGIGRAATPQEVQAWDIDVRPDFKGLPAGSGSVAKGQAVWEGKCASCHGVFGESNEVFSPLVGGTTAADIQAGRVANLRRTDYPGRTTLMKLSSVSTLWDYINRAMPWNAPKSLSVEEVYAVTAYMLHLGEIVPADFTLSDRNIAQVQKKLPNRDGMSTDHALWPGKEFAAARRPDVQARACMANCSTEPKVASLLPDHARGSHGNLAEQNRLVGAQRGIALVPVTAAPAAAATAAPAAPAGGAAAKAQELAKANTCTACHAPAAKLVGPSWADISARHKGKPDYLAGKIRSGGVGAWGTIPMPPQSLSEADAKVIGAWLAGDAP